MTDEKVYRAGVERLRLPERLAILEVDKVTALALQGIAARTILDVGTGSGIFAEAFAARGTKFASLLSIRDFGIEPPKHGD